MLTHMGMFALRGKVELRTFGAMVRGGLSLSRLCVVLGFAFCCQAQQGPVRLAITPANSFVSIGQHLQLQAAVGFIGNKEAGQDVSLQVSWTSSNPDVANVNASGNVSPTAMGTTIITARRGPFYQATTVTVVPAAAVTSLNVSPAAPSVPKGISQQFIATATFPDNSTQDVSAAALWISSDSPVASVALGLGTTDNTGSLS